MDKAMSKKVEATRIQQELCDKVFTGGLLSLHGCVGHELVPALMTMNVHTANKAFYRVLNDHKIERSADDFKYSSKVDELGAFVKEDQELYPKAFGRKGKQLRELAAIFATMADTFDVIDKWSETND